MKKTTLFNILNIAGVSKILRSQKKSKLTIFSLHRISYKEDFFWNPIHPDNFEKLLQYLMQHYSIISFSDIPGLKEAGKTLKPFLILSFDDGYYDFYEYALPLLIKYKLPANHNIVNECATNNHVIWTQKLNTLFNHCRNNDLTGLTFNHNTQMVNLASSKNNWMHFYLKVYKLLLDIPQKQRMEIIADKEIFFSISTNERMMNWDEIKECSRNKVEIGCHTYSHDVLSTISDKEILYHEILHSATEIENRLNKKINILALPNGQKHTDIYEMAEEAGISHILYAGDKINDLKKYFDKGIHNSYRINLVQESLPEMILRAELFHSKMKKYV